MSSRDDRDVLRVHLLHDRLGWWGIGVTAGGRVGAIVLPARGRAGVEAALRRRAEGMGLVARRGGCLPRDAVDAIHAWRRGARPARAPRLDLRGVRPFDRRVLEAVRRIPYGQTRTYGQIAAAAGRPSAARAAGGALGRNPVPLFVPCHRVVRADGGLGGFSASGGTALKEWMLAHEAHSGAREGSPRGRTARDWAVRRT